MQYHVSTILQKLREVRTPPSKLSPPNKAGVYAFFGLTPKIGPLLCGGEVIYIGTSENLKRRPCCDHFISGETGRSAPRRTLGAIVKEELQLKARARGKGKSKQDISHYRFDDEGEQRLTDWMQENIGVGTYVYDGNLKELKELETDLIRKARPILNLIKWPNPQKSEIEKLMEICRQEAKAS